MRVLFTTVPEKTIFQYLAPLAWAMRTAGHEVRFASQPKFADVITQAGLTAQPVGSNRDLWRIANMFPEQREQERVGLPVPYDVADEPGEATWEHMLDGYREAVSDWHKMCNFPMTADLVAFAREWQPDLIIWEPLTYAGAIAAKACGAAHARLLYSLDVFGVARDHFLRLKRERGESADPLAEWLGSYAAKYGGEYTEDLATGQFTIDQFPASLTIQAPGLHYLRTQYIPYGGPAVVPAWLRQAPEKPRVALTMGLSATDHYSGYTIKLQDVLDALADLDIELVATIAGEAYSSLDVPDNARIVSFVPLHALAPTCSAVIHHAGAATLATVSRYGVPQLAVHLHFDQPALARKLAAQGAGLALANDEATGESVRESVLRLLTEPVFAEAAGRLREEIESVPSPNALVPNVEELVAKYRERA